MDYKTGWHCFSLSLLTDSIMCVGDEGSLLQENKYFITIIWTQSCLLLSDDVCMKEIATTSFKLKCIIFQKLYLK